jgi:hypothetical protein
MTAVVPASGLVGWTFLQRTASRQIETLAAQPVAQRNEAWFRERIGQIGTAADLVADRRLLEVALTAFGLESDIDNRFFIRKVLEDGTLRNDALSNRLETSSIVPCQPPLALATFRRRARSFPILPIGSCRSIAPGGSSPRSARRITVCDWP